MQIIGESIPHNQHSKPAYIFTHSHSKFKYIVAFLLKKITVWKEIKKERNYTSSSVFTGGINYLSLCFGYTSLSYV